jgi:tellurite resistance protein TerC
MGHVSITYIIFTAILILNVVFDLGLLSKKETQISVKKALYQTSFWVALALAFFGFLCFEEGHKIALEYLSAYLMEWSLSIDNIFVFILIFTFFAVKKQYFARVLLIGILLAVLFRIIFISIGVALVEEFHWVLYIFGGILLYTGIAMFRAKEEDMDLEKSRVYQLLKRFLPITTEDAGGRFSLVKNKKRYYTNILVVVVLLATTDIIFALDSIPAVFGISQNRLVIYTSNIFAVLGLRSLFFLLKGAVSKFRYLQHGIATVLIFIGLKMLVEVVGVFVPVFIPDGNPGMHFPFYSFFISVNKEDGL